MKHLCRQREKHEGKQLNYAIKPSEREKGWKKQRGKKERVGVEGISAPTDQLAGEHTHLKGAKESRKACFSSSEFLTHSSSPPPPPATPQLTVFSAVCLRSQLTLDLVRDLIF